MTSAVEDTRPDVEAPMQEEYYGFIEDHKFYFPDEVTYIQFQAMNEGLKKRFQRTTSRDVVLERSSGNARMKVDPGQERWDLLEACVNDWNLIRNGKLVPFSARALKEWLELANPKLVEDLELAIRKVNPFLLADMTVADIDKEIENLKEMRKVAEERERGE